MESLFFPGELDEGLMLVNVSASVELPVALGGCLQRTQQQDFALALAEVSGGSDVQVQFWCAPRVPSSTVYRSARVGYGPTTVPGALLDLQFGDDTGGWLGVLSQLADGTQGVFIVNSSGIFQTPPVVSALLGNGNTLLRVENLWVVEGFLLVDVLARQLSSYTDPQTGKLGAEAATLSIRLALLPPLGTNVSTYGIWRATDVDLLRFGRGDYWYTRLAEGDYLFLPKYAGLLPGRARLMALDKRLVMPQPVQILGPVSLPSSMGDATLAARAQQPGAVFATSRTGWDWLKQVRLSASGVLEGVHGTAGVEFSVEIQGSCDEHSCEGCASIQTQRLCLAYQKCALINCIGTPVHQRRPLCGIGALLRQTGRMGLVSTQGAWAIFAEMLGLALRLTLLNLKEAYLLWPEDQFLCFMCQAKDSSAQFFSILTATVNAALQLGRADVGYMYGGASNVDTNADAVLTISSTAINAFMHQLTLLPLYGMAVSHQIMMCQVSGVIALVPTGDFKVSIRSGKDTPAGDLIAGQCLTLGAEVLASFPQDDSPSLGATVISLVSNALERLLIAQIEPIVHIADGTLAYLIGVGKALGGLVQSQNMARCSPPDFFLKDVVRCACGDHELQIPDSRRREGVQQAALWCTGVLGMMDSNNQPYYVHNPYTYAELQARSAGLQAYVDCVGRESNNRGYSCIPPNEPYFAKQGVTTINVLVKCRENFVKRRWDPAAYMLFQPASWDQVQFQDDPVLPTGLPFHVGECLSSGDAATGSLVQSCHEAYLNDAALSSEAYWQYERRNDTRSGPEYTDACLVFTGPADKGLPQFRACVDGMEEAQACGIPAHLWTPRSDNDVPLASQHRVLSYGNHKDGLVQGLYAQAHAIVMDAIQASLAVWNTSSGTPEVNAEFFSVEGDVLHQTMDCIFMGPYSRVDYWPIPDCPAGEECLQGPFWARDEGSGQGRHVDPTACPAAPTLPYTCGSPARRSLMRYLLLRLLPESGGPKNQNASNVATILRTTLEDLARRWDDTSLYGCHCADGVRIAPSCCATNLSAPLLPEHLAQPYTHIDGQSILLALQDDMARLYDEALESRAPWLWFMQDVAPNETAAYDWSGSKRVTEEARFDPTNATAGYEAATDALSPLAEEDSSLWDVCHASLKQVFFTLPVDPAGAVRFDATNSGEFDGDPARLEEFVRVFTAEAFERSPLFRHYSPRHAPSPSQMCAQPAADETLASVEGSVGYAPFVQAGTTLLDSAQLPKNRVFHPQRFLVGADACLCGWPRRGNRCFPPTQANTLNLVCAALGTCQGDGSYGIEEDAAAFALFSSDWYCPQTDLSAHWGFLDPSANEQWLALNVTSSLTTASRDLFRHGRAGLRAGNLGSLPNLAKQYVNPATREISLKRGRLTTCQPPPPVEDLMRPFLDQLFPAAQGVEEAGALSYCLRYAIELARLQVFRLLDLPELDGQLALQREVAARWRKRCGAQLHLLHVCVSLGAFKPLAEPAAKDTVGCPHFFLTQIPASVVAYTTPACLVSVDGAFYDPCRASDLCAQGGALKQSVTLAAILALGDKSRLRFDPRTLLQRGAPIGWIDGQHPLPDPEAALLRSDFADSILADPDAAGNAPTNGPPWWRVEGPMAENSEFCDGVLDWWPEEWAFPVGYHVTVPCEANETAFRGFAQSFALDEDTYSLVYQHDLLRDATLVDTHFGGAGLCRAGSFGMPMPETNNMRYCTSIPAEDTEDFTLPQWSRPLANDAWTEWKCTSSSAQLPWPTMLADQAEHQSSRYSVGTIPNMPPETSPTYPATSQAMFHLGPWQEIQDAGNSWGRGGDSACQDFMMLRCPNETACPDGYACRGRVCMHDYTVNCQSDADCNKGKDACRGVCVAPAVQCIRHSDCPDGKMCSGVGTCETPVLAVQNLLRLANDSVTLSLAARGNSCGPGSRAYSMLQASYWGNTGQDLLRAHGMCSFEDWFKYTRFYSQPGCSVPAPDGSLRLDPAQCKLVDLEQLDANQSKWWPPGNARPELMFLRPTVCDRDYERLRGFTQCAPLSGQATVLTTSAGQWETTSLDFEQFVRLHANTSTREILLANMNERNQTRTGFLGMGIISLDELSQNPFIACGGIGQCYPPKFTLEGQPVKRTVRRAPSAWWANYSEQDAFVCGSFGLLIDGQCVLDVDRFPLYQLLCVQRVQSCRPFDDTGVTRACTSIQNTYQASNQDRMAVLQGLRDLFYVIPLFSTLEQYLQVTACVADVYAGLQALSVASQGNVGLGLYFPFMFALYEIPFDWFYQCIVMTGTRIQTAQHALQTCRPYATRGDHAPASYLSVSTAGDTYQTYLQHVRAGYLPKDVLAYQAAQVNASQVALDAAVAELVGRMFPSNRQDLSYPRCSRNILWRVGPHGDAYDQEGYVPEQRAVIWNWYDSQSCTLQWHEQLLQRLETLGINRDTWIESLTDYDPANLVRQDGAGGTTVIQEARQFMLSQLAVLPLDVVPSGSTGAIRFDDQPPAAYDAQARPLPASLAPTLSSLDGTTDMDESVPRTCVFLPAYDPAFIRLPGFSLPDCGKVETRNVTITRVDHLRTCQNTDCSTIPIYQRRNGKFNCRYVAGAVIDDGACTENTPGCEADVMAKVYAQMRLRYREIKAVDPPVLAPTVFPWFAPPRPWAFDAVDLSSLLDYESNIQPDPQRAIMCEISSDAASAVQFTTCNNPHYLRLKQHVADHYKHDGGVRIPAGGQLEWPLDRSVLAQGIMLSYANSNRSIRKRFVDALFDDTTVCKGEQAQHVCRKESATSLRFRTVNPWLLGNFNPYEVCDVDFTSAGQGSREYIYTYCLEQGNQACSEYYARAPSQCQAKHRKLVTQVGVPRFDMTGQQYNDYNLCFHAIEEDKDGCMHDQGLLGGFDGLPVGSPAETSVNMLAGTAYAGRENYTVARHLYENSEWSIPDDFEGGMFAGTNPLWFGGDAPYGFLRIDENDIGGHRIGVAVARENETIDYISSMSVVRLALGVQADRRFLDDPITGLHVQDWLEQVQYAMAEEDREVRRLYEGKLYPADLGVSCPLQRWAFYSGDYTSFSPSLPAAKRAQHLFHRVHGGQLAHPTMLPSDAGQFLGKYRSSNGFCACPVITDIPQPQCLVPVNQNSPCSLRTTIQSLMGDLPIQSYVFPAVTNQKATRPCAMQLDWPTVDGTLRDGTPVNGHWEDASSPSNRECHVLDRLRPFQYKYHAASTLAPSGKNTVRDGSCATARLVTLQASKLPTTFARCLRDNLYDTSATFRCNTTTSGATFSLPRRSRLTLTEVLARRDARRVPCSRCARPPAFRSQQGRPLPPESSFGRLTRHSPERLLAKDLREALCPAGATRCPALNESAWRTGEFMRNYMQSPHRLFVNRTALNNNGTTPPPQEDPRLWTQRPWVYCPSAEALRTGEGCLGTITRSDWEKRRTTVCPQMVRSFSSRVLNRTGNDPMARTTFCPIDNTTDAVCGAITRARELIRQANCIARGDPNCMPSPFVYHPASYEPSNNAWIHDSVKAFYSRVDVRACPHNTSTDSSLIAFARAYQQSCPANGVNLFVGVLQAVRVVVVDVALLVTTVIAMLFRTLQLFISSGRAVARQQIGKNWAYIRSKARESVNTVGDLLVDTLLNSGVVGERIMAFLHQACGGLNSAVEWFLNVWCNYIQKYTLQLLAGLRKLLGITGAGFEILQDFMDEVFQGILPAAFVAKYAKGVNFQSMLTEYYSEPRKKKQKQVLVNGVKMIVDDIPDSANLQQESRSAKQKGVLTRLFGPAGRAFRAVAKAGAIAGTFAIGYDLVTGIMSAVEDERLRGLYPENFTLFDLSDVMNVIDDMEEFILSPLSQQTCASFQLIKKADPDHRFFPCIDLRLDQYAGTSAGTTSIAPTMCWANAAPSLGQNSMFSCVASSTCVQTAGSTTNYILCATCPDPVLPGINKYGCDSLLQQCTCSQPRVSYTLCTQNRQCGPNSECELRSSLSPLSYGTIPCGNCPATARLMCVLSPTGMPARCTCMLAGAPSYDLCSDRTGTRTAVDPTRICGYQHNRPQNLVHWAFDMDDLIMLPCAQIATGVCSDVVTNSQTGDSLRMVVAETLRLGSGGGRRRLLQEDEVAPEPGPPVYDAYESEYELSDSQALHELLTAPGWNTTAAPCSTLALAYQAGEPKLGLLETHVLRTCAFWRYVGRRVLARYNLTEALAGHETFLLSMDDLVYALMTPSAAAALLLNPGVFVSAYLHHPWMKPVRALGLMVANQLEYLLWVRSIDEDVHEALFGDLSPEEHAQQERERAVQRIQQRVISPRNRTHRPARPRDKHSNASFPRRRLLTAGDVLAYSARLIQNPDSAGFLPQRVYGAWSTSDFAWPPRYNYSLAACPIALSALDLGTQVALVNKMYFQNFDAPARKRIDRSLRANLPDWGWTANATQAASSSTGGSSWASAAFYWMLGVFGVQPQHLVALVTSDHRWSLAWVLASLTQCDLASTLTCSRHEKDLLMSTVVFALMFFAIHAVSSALGAGFVSILFLLSYPWFILWYVFGMAPTCFPLLPTCLLSDVIATVEAVLPRRILFPANLVCDTNQNSSCLRSCTELAFTGWADPLAFAVCDTDPATCRYLRDFLPSTGVALLDEQIREPWQQAVRRSLALIDAGEALDGHRLCTWVSFITVVPVLFLITSVFVILAVLINAVMDLLPPLIALVCQSAVFYES